MGRIFMKDKPEDINMGALSYMVDEYKRELFSLRGNRIKGGRGETC